MFVSMNVSHFQSYQESFNFIFHNIGCYVFHEMIICCSFHSCKAKVERQTSSSDEYIPESSSSEEDSSADEEDVYDGSSDKKATPSSRGKKKPQGNKSSHASSSRSRAKSCKAHTKQSCTTPVSMH